VPSKADFDNLFNSIKTALMGMSDLASTLSTDALIRAESIANSSLAIFAAIKAAVDALTPLRGYQSIGTDVFAALIADFNSAVNVMINGLSVSEKFMEIAKEFEANIMTGASHLANAVNIFIAAIKNLGFGLAAFGVQVILPTPPVGDNTVTPNSFSGSFTPSVFAPIGRANATAPVVNNYNFAGISLDANDPRVPKLQSLMAEIVDLVGVGTGVNAALAQQS
jgi:hypothetical protein